VKEGVWRKEGRWRRGDVEREIEEGRWRKGRWRKGDGGRRMVGGGAGR
jgi:hypothetical protein